MPRLLDLPNELLESIVWHLDCGRDISAAVRTNRRLFALCIDYLYLFNSRSHENDGCTNSSACDWAAQNGCNDTLRRALNAGVSISQPSRFTFAAEHGNLDTLQLLLLYSPEYWHLNDENVYGETILETASRKGHLPIVEFLVNRGASLNSSRISPAIHLATIGGHIDTVRFLLSKGVSASTRCHLELAPLHVAAQKGHVEIVRLLLDHGVFVDVVWSGDLSTPLHMATRSNHITIIELLIKYGASLCAKNELDYTPLLLAISMNHPQATKQLLEQKANAGERHEGEAEKSALSIASGSGYDAIVSLLLDYGADIEATDRCGDTALIASALGGHSTTFELLVKRGANTGQLKTSGWIRLNTVVEEGSHEAAKIFLEHGAWDTCADNVHRNPALYAASQNGCVKMVKLLLEHGANANASLNHSGQTGLHIAAENAHEDLVEFLLGAVGVDVDIQDYFGRTPLFLAAKSRRYHMVKTLLTRNAATNAKDIYGASPIFAAVRNGHSEVARLLLKAAPLSLSSKDIFGYSPYWWASKTSQPNLTRLLDKIALQNGIQILESEIRSGPDSAHMFLSGGNNWCDVCARCITCRTAIDCVICRVDKYAVCDDCVTEDKQCLEGIYSISRLERRADCFSHTDFV